MSFDGNAWRGWDSAQSLSKLGALARAPNIPSAVAAAVSSAYVGGATPWARLYGPNEFRTAWAASAEWTTAVSYVTAASAANGPAMFRREGASMMIDFSKATQTYGNFRNVAAGLAANTFANKPIAVLVYIHRMHANMALRLRIGTDTGNYIYYNFGSANGLLVEGWNQVLCHTSEAIGIGGAPNGQNSFQTVGAINDGWYVGAGTFNPNTNGATINYLAVEFLNYCTAVGNSRAYAWVEGIYIGGKDKPRVTIGFDIQTAGLDGAKTTMDAYGLVGYAAVPTANGAPANPQALWNAGDVARLQALYASGWDIVQHSVSHNSLGTLADESAIAAELEACRAQIVAAGVPGGADLHATPNNSYSNRLIAAMAKTGVLWARHGINAPLLVPRGLVGLVNPLLQGAVSMANQPDAVRTLAFIDLAILYGASVHLYTHAVSASPAAIDTNITVFDAICAGLRSRINSGQIEVVTPSAFIRDCAPPKTAAILATPSRLSLTPGASPFDLFNTGYAPLRFVISGGTVSQISYSRDGTTFDVTGQTAGDFEVNPGDRLRINYSAAPTIIQYSV